MNPTSFHLSLAMAFALGCAVFCAVAAICLSRALCRFCDSLDFVGAAVYSHRVALLGRVPEPTARK